MKMVATVVLVVDGTSWVRMDVERFWKDVFTIEDVMLEGSNPIGADAAAELWAPLVMEEVAVEELLVMKIEVSDGNVLSVEVTEGVEKLLAVLVVVLW